MDTIRIIHQPEQVQLKEMGVYSWPIWEKEVSEFPWHYVVPETCYVLEGEVIVTPDGGDPVVIAAGDLVTFPRGLSCTWRVTHALRKHYSFD